MLTWLLLVLASYSPLMRADEDEAKAVSEAVMGCYERHSLDPVQVLAHIAQESSFDSDPCSKRVRSEIILSQTPVEGRDDQTEITWTCSSRSGGTRTCARIAWDVSERDGYVYFNTCSAGEIGYLQILGHSRWARAGTPIPGTDEVLARRSGERRLQLQTARVNIALGCSELADHREAAGKTADDPWWEWAGAFNTGTVHGETSKRYARRIMRRYLELCAIPVEEGTDDAPPRLLRDVWDGCAVVAEALEDD